MTHGPTKSYYMEHSTLEKIPTQNHILKEAIFLYNNQKLEKLVVYWDIF